MPAAKRHKLTPVAQRNLIASAKLRYDITVLVAQGMSQTEIAKHLGMTRQRVNQIAKELGF